MSNQKKKILFSAYSLEVGGIETALVNLLNYLYKTNKYEITLVLEKKAGVLLNKLNEDIKIIEYAPSYNKLFGKFINAIKRVTFSLKYKNKYDASFAYATYCKMASATAQMASNNCNLWVHSSYLDIFNNDNKEYVKFFNELNINRFKNILFVSNRSKEEFEEIMNKHNTILCNNVIDYKNIKDLSQEKILEEKIDKCTFLYVGRIVEDSKKISRLLEAANILKEKNLNYRILVIGNGRDYKKAIQYVHENSLEERVVFLGEKVNPYPYFKIADALILVSENEGYPVVYNEAKILNLPIITTDVSDSKLDIDKRFGIVCNQDVESIVDVMERLIKNGQLETFGSLEIFDAEKYNNEIKNKLEKIIEERT